MKKWLCVMGIVFLSVLCVRPVYADVINEPRDSFYERHAEECVYVNRMFTANGPDGKVFCYASPESPRVTAAWENGMTAWISFTYRDGDGILWGIAEGHGWMPMAYMEVVYDSISFAEEYADEITGEIGTLDEQYMGKEIYLWTYPGSMEEKTITTGEFMPEYRSVYVDEAGRSWGNLGYYYGFKNEWICIDDPTADAQQLWPDGAPQRGQGLAGNAEAAPQGAERIVPQTNRFTVILTVVLVGMVAAVSAALLVVLKRRGRNR
ncbi:MAG: hypothetical protein NC337_12955 [Roseburia sp.]|nr:hypothetical protein [Roseburia sp.]